MRISEMLHAIANYLESPDNEALLLSEYDDDCMTVVAESCVTAAHALRVAADKVDAIEPPEESKITPEAIENLGALAAAFDASGDPELKKQASVIDELLLTIAADPSLISRAKEAEDYRLEELKKKYQNPKKELDELNKVSDALKAIDKSKMTKDFKILEAPLSTRYCPDHPGAQIARIGEHVWQCDLDKKTYNFETGFDLENGDHVPGGDVAAQTQGISAPTHAIFDTREGRLGTNQT
jgi:hypothetical protein